MRNEGLRPAGLKTALRGNTTVAGSKLSAFFEIFLSKKITFFMKFD